MKYKYFLAWFDTKTKIIHNIIVKTDYDIETEVGLNRLTEELSNSIGSGATIITWKQLD